MAAMNAKLLEYVLNLVLTIKVHMLVNVIKVIAWILFIKLHVELKVDYLFPMLASL